MIVRKPYLVQTFPPKTQLCMSSELRIPDSASSKTSFTLSGLRSRSELQTLIDIAVCFVLYILPSPSCVVPCCIICPCTVVCRWSDGGPRLISMGYVDQERSEACELALTLGVGKGSFEASKVWTRKSRRPKYTYYYVVSSELCRLCGFYYVEKGSRGKNKTTNEIEKVKRIRKRVPCISNSPHTIIVLHT